ncbi:MAG: hypothetical protein WC581_11010 [Thermodesulfovibrionales bacterium]
MSYSSLNKLNSNAKVKDIVEIIDLLGYKCTGLLRSGEVGKIRDYFWFDEKDYHSWSGVELSIYEVGGLINIETRTPVGRSYFDLEQQNRTIRLLRKNFGGSFSTDEGKGQYLNLRSGPPTPAASGCHLAFQRFGANLITSHVYFMNRNYKGPKHPASGINYLDKMNPWLISNNLLLPFLVSLFEDYWKSTYIALLSYSKKKETILKSGRISAERLASVSCGQFSIEHAFAETMPFQRISAICTHFTALDSKLNFCSILQKPYRRRKISLFKSLQEMTELRHQVIHRAEIDSRVNDTFTKGLFHNIEVAVVKCYQHITKTYGWHYDKWWHTGKY